MLYKNLLSDYDRETRDRCRYVLRHLSTHLAMAFQKTKDAPTNRSDKLEEHNPDRWEPIATWALQSDNLATPEGLLSDDLVWDINEHCRAELDYHWMTDKARFAYEYSLGPRGS